jgi:Transposase
MILSNLFVASVKRKGIDTAETSGDDTGYSLTVTKRYLSLKVKNCEIVKGVRFVYSFALMDLTTRMHVGYPVSVKSERDTYYRGLDMIRKMNIDLKSARLDKYHSGENILEDFIENTIIFIIPKKNSRIRKRSKWRDFIMRFMDDPMNYLREYFKRNALESGFSSDKRTTGGLIYQRRNDRKETSGLCKGLIDNLMLSHG